MRDSGNNFGEGNLGARGFAKFLQTHRCNCICRYLQLSPIHPIDPRQDDGTAPTATATLQRQHEHHHSSSVTTVSGASLSRVPFREPHYYARSHVLANVDDSSSTALSHSSLGSSNGLANAAAAGRRWARGGSTSGGGGGTTTASGSSSSSSSVRGRIRAASSSSSSRGHANEAGTPTTVPRMKQDVQQLGCRCSIM